jgi:hypothetical protein
VPAKSGKQWKGAALTMLGRPRWHCDELPTMDGGSGIGYVQLAPGGGEEGMSASGRLDSRGGGETAKKGGAQWASCRGTEEKGENGVWLEIENFDIKYGCEVFSERNNFLHRNFFRFEMDFELKIREFKV